MEQVFSDIVFDKTDYKVDPPAKGEYENCDFRGCDLSGTDLSGIRFIECRFTGCNLSLAKLTGTGMQDVQFANCKMLGLRFDECSEFVFAVRFEQCVLGHSSFYKIKMKKTVFRNTQLEEVDFSECDLGGAAFENCDLRGATFDNTILEKADLRTPCNYSIDPERNKIKKAQFSLPAVVGLLDKYNIEIAH